MNPFSPFPIVYNIERPDDVSGNLLEGCVAIFLFIILF
ncbi:spore germination protein [Paenibacillus sp. FSL K6-0276]